MRRTLICLPVVLLIACSLAACTGGGTGLVIVPDKVKKATVADGEYKNVHAVYLYDVGFADFDPMDVGHSQYPTYQFSEYAKVKLLTRAATEGRRWGNRRVRHIGEMKEVEAWVIKPDGTRNKLGPNDIKSTVVIKDIVPGATPQIDLYETQIIFPGLEPGDTIEYNYTRRGRDTQWMFSKLEAPVKYSKFMLARPMRRIEIQPLIYDRHDLKPEKDEQQGIVKGMTGRIGSRRATYDIWEVTDVPPLERERSMPPLVDVASRLRVWQGDRRWEWSALGETYWKWFNHYGKSAPKAKELADEALEGVGSDPKERAKAIHDWVKQNLNIQDYNQLSWVPRQIEIEVIDLGKLIKEKNATPEQAANLMFMMMQAAGVDAGLVLTTAYDDSPAEEGLPDLYQFTYPLLELPDGTMIDASDRFVPFGVVPFWFEGRKALSIKEGQVSFKDLPVSPPGANKVTRTIRGKLDPEGNAEVEVTVVSTGQRALGTRLAVGSMTPKEREVALQESITDAAPKAELGEFAFTDLDQPDKPVKLVYAFKVPRYAQVLRDKQVVKLGAFVHLTSCPELTSEKRTSGVWQRYKWQEEMDIQVAMPLGFSLEALPKGFRTRDYDTGTALGVQTSYGSPDGKVLHVIRKLSFNETYINPDTGYPIMRKMIQRYLAQKDTLITLKLPKMD